MAGWERNLRVWPHLCLPGMPWGSQTAAPSCGPPVWPRQARPEVVSRGGRRAETLVCTASAAFPPPPRSPTSGSGACAIFSFVPGSPGSLGRGPPSGFGAVPIENAPSCPLSAQRRPALSCLEHLSCWQFPNRPPPRPSGKDTVAGLALAVSSDSTHRHIDTWRKETQLPPPS